MLHMEQWINKRLYDLVLFIEKALETSFCADALQTQGLTNVYLHS